MSTYPFGARSPVRITFGAGMAYVGLFALLPAVAIFVLSFTNIRGIPNLPVEWVGWENFRDFFGPAQWDYNLRALEHTVVFAVVTTVVQNALALLIAVLLNQRLRGSNFYRAVVFLPTVLGVTVIGLIWSLIFNPVRGPAATVWSWFGTDSAFFGDPALALPLLIFVQVWTGVGIGVVIFLAGLQAIPSDYYEAADLDGAGRWAKLRLVTVPLLAPSVTANVLLSIVGALQSYQLAYVLTGTRNPATSLLSLVVYAQAFGGGESGSVVRSQGYAAAVSAVQFVVVGLVSLLVFAYLRRREVQL